MYEKSLTGRDRLPNYEDDDYIFWEDGKKRLNPNWEYARECRKKNYFRCPVCNQGIAFIIDHTDSLYFIYPKVNKEGFKKTGIMSFECFENDVLPALYAYKDKELIYNLCGDVFFDPFEHVFSCYHCFVKTGERKLYKPEQLIKKYQKPYDPGLCDYTDICNICGDQVYETVIPEKINDSIIMHKVFMCSNDLCNFKYM